MFTAVYAVSTTPNAMMNVHDPPNEATASAMRSPAVSFSSMTSLGFRAARSRTSWCAEWNWRPSTVSMSIPASGLRCSRFSMSLPVDLDADRLLGGERAGLVRRLLEHRGEPEEVAAAGSSTTTSWWSSSIVVTRTRPDTMT